MSNIIRIQDLIDIRARKQQELEFYNKQLEDLKMKMFWINQEIDLTNTIIIMIEKEKLLDLREVLK